MLQTPMKPFFPTKPLRSRQGRLRLASPLLLACLLAPAALAQPATPPAKPAPPDPSPALQEIVFVKSAFADEPGAGNDPFFPKSTRRNKRAPDAAQVTPIRILNSLFLKGISGTKDRKLALINNRTFEVGEIGEFREGNQAIKIHVVEITEKSVFFTTEGSNDRKELCLRNGL